VPSILESSKLHLSSEEVSTYRAAAERLCEACEIALDLTQPITVDQWMFLEVACAAIDGHFEPLDRVIAKVQAEVELRKVRKQLAGAPAC
jgi:hypothetical protein